MGKQGVPRSVPYEPFVSFVYPFSLLCSRHGCCSILRALQKAGIEQVPDLNSPHAPAACTGRTDHIVDSSNGRDSTYRAFLSPRLTQERKSRLKICTNALVGRVQLTESANEISATGVMFEASDPRLARRQYFARARKEVILCAGAFGSPQVLMLRFVGSFQMKTRADQHPSGLGPKEHLREKGIPIVRDLPAVGKHLVCTCRSQLSSTDLKG